MELQNLKDIQSAASGTKTIYFDSNDVMYTQEEIKDVKQRLTKMVVRVPEQERKRLVDEQERHKKLRLESFVQQIQTSKSEFNGRQLRSSNKLKIMSQPGKYGSHMSTSSGGENDGIKLQARHFKNKEGAVFLNMFETISTNYCLNNNNSSSQRRQSN